MAIIEYILMESLRLSRPGCMICCSVETHMPGAYVDIFLESPQDTNDRAVRSR
jgi:hypothetical protein